MRTSTPPCVAVSVKVSTLFNPSPRCQKRSSRGSGIHRVQRFFGRARLTLAADLKPRRQQNSLSACGRHRRDGICGLKAAHWHNAPTLGVADCSRPGAGACRRRCSVSCRRDATISSAADPTLPDCAALASTKSTSRPAQLFGSSTMIGPKSSQRRPLKRIIWSCLLTR